MDEKRILVTGIGGNVGQGILRNILASGLTTRLFGCNTVAFSAGNHFCEKTFQVPPAYHSNYIAAMQQLVSENNIDLIIPSTDYEVFYLSRHKSLFPCAIAVSGQHASETYLDKYKSFLHHKKNGLPFAESFLPAQYNGQFKEIIAKPREGRGSRGLVINPADLSGFSDEQYMIQEYHSGKEITTAFYVDRAGHLHGLITMERSLENGATSECRVIKDYDSELEKIILKMISLTDFAGSANIQCIVNATGNIVPFEINCRISGTNSIRSNFGFKNVYYTLQEYLLNQKPDAPVITEGKAIRILMDIIYPVSGNAGGAGETSYIF